MGGDGGGAGAGGAARGSRSSAWNQAGMWEEKDTTSWCKARLTALVSAVAVESGGGEQLLRDDPSALLQELSAGLASAGGGAAAGGRAGPLRSIMGNMANVRAKVTDVKDLKGDASVAVIRGKPRYLFDFSFDLPFAVEVDESGGLFGDGAAGEEDTKKKKKKKNKKYKGKLCYPDCSATCNGDFESNVSWKTRPPADCADTVTKAVGMLRAEVHAAILRFVAAYSEEQ